MVGQTDGGRMDREARERVTLDHSKLIALAAQGRIDKTDWLIIDAIYNQGMLSYSLIAETTGIPRRTVYRRARRLGTILPVAP